MFGKFVLQKWEKLRHSQMSKTEEVYYLTRSALQEIVKGVPWGKVKDTRQ